MAANSDSNSNKRKQAEVDSDGNQKIDTVFQSDSKPEKAQDASTSSETEEPPKKSQRVDVQEDAGQSAEARQESEKEKKLTQKRDQEDSKKDQTTGLKVDDVDVEEKSNQDENKYTLLERGHIFFFYRPKVQPASKDSSDKLAGSLNQVQSFHILLLPDVSSSENVSDEKNGEKSASSDAAASSTGDKAKTEGIGFRLIRMGKKRLPEAEMVVAQGEAPGGIGGDSAETLWAEITDVGADPKELQGNLGEQRYSTRTSGDRLVGASRAAGRGHYVLSLKHAPESAPSQKQVQLSYVLSHPSSEDFGPVQKSFGLHDSSSLDLKIRNPTLPGSDAGGPIGLDESSKAQLSKEELKENFGGDAQQDGTGYGIPENVGLLDKTGIELLVIKSRKQEVDGDQGMGDDQKKSESAVATPINLRLGAGFDLYVFGLSFIITRPALEQLAASESKSMSNMDVLKELSLSSKNPVEALDGTWI